MKIFNMYQRSQWVFALMVIAGCNMLSGASLPTKNAESFWLNPGTSDTAVLMASDSVASKPKKTISLLPEKAENRLVLLGMFGTDIDVDNRIVMLSAMLHSGDLEKMTHWYLPMQPYGIALLKQYISTGDTFSKVAMKGIYFENSRELDTLLTELRRLYLKKPDVVNKWVIKTCYPTLNDSERGYALALKKYFDKPDIPFAIRYQVESLLANSIFSYYRILDDLDDENDDIMLDIGYLDANFDYYETFKAFAKAFDSLNSEYKVWLPANEFAEVKELMDYYNKSIKTNQRDNDGLFEYIESRNQLEGEIVALVNGSAKNKVMLLAPTEELILNDKKIGFVSILRGLLSKGISKNHITRIITFSGSSEQDLSIPSDSFTFINEDDLFSGSLSSDEDEGYFVDYFLYGINTKDSEDSTYRAVLGKIYKQYKELKKEFASDEFEITNSHFAFSANDGDNSGISTYALMPGKVFHAYSDSSLREDWKLDEDADNSDYSSSDEYDYESPNYSFTEIPKLRHSSAQIEVAYSFMVNQMAERFANNLNNVLSENNLGSVNTSMGYRGIALNLLSSGEKNNAKTYQYWGMRVGEFQTSNKYLSGFHLGYLQGTAFAMDKKRRVYLNFVTYLEGFDTKLSLPMGSMVGGLTNPLSGKTFKAVGTVYGLMLGTTVRLNRLFVHANVGYGWDLSNGTWFYNKSAISGISPVKYTGVNYGVQAGYKFGLYKKSSSEYDWSSEAAVDSVAVFIPQRGATTSVGNKITASKHSKYRMPNLAEKGWKAVSTKSGDTAEMVMATEDSSISFDPAGYHYDFNDAEISAAAVKMLTSRAKKARIVLAGENHRYVKFNSRSEFRWMKLLYENAGYRNYLLELSPARAVFLERYICHGDTVAQKIIQATASARFMVLFDSLAAWQMTLPESERIKIFGLDVERFADMTVMWLNDIATRREQTLPGTKSGVVPASIQAGVRAINHLGANYFYLGQRDYKESLEEFLSEQRENESKISSTEAKVNSDIGEVNDTAKTMERVIYRLDDWRRLDYSRITFNEDPSISELYRYIDSLQGDFKNWLGPMWPEFSQALARLREVYEWEKREDQAQQYQWREEIMYRNMVTLLEKYPNSKFFGQFGRCHVGLSKQQQDCGWFEYNSILARLRTRYFKNDTSVMNIGIFYKENEEDVDDISSSDLLHNVKIRDEVTNLYLKTEENTMIYNMEEPTAKNSELRKKFNFVVIIGQEQAEEEDYSSTNDDENSEGGSEEEMVNMGGYMGYGYGTHLGSMVGESMQNYLETNENISINNSVVSAYNTLFLGYRSKHVSMQYGLGYKLRPGEFFNDQQASLTGQWITHGVSMYLHNANVFNKKSLHYGLGLGYTFGKQTLTYQKVEYQLGSVTDPVELVNYRGMPTASVVLGIMKNNVGLDLEAGYRFQNNESVWEYRGSRLPFATAGFVNGVSGDLMKLPFATINLRVVFEGSQPVYRPADKDSEDSDD